MDRQNNPARIRAKNLLKSYLITMFEIGGLKWTNENGLEAESIVDQIIEAASDQCIWKTFGGGFKEIYGREPIAGKDFDPGGDICQDDYEFLTSTGRYNPTYNAQMLCSPDDVLEDHSLEDEEDHLDMADYLPNGERA